MTTVILIAAAFLGGALNSLAGGGSLVTFPALLFAGLNPIDANASSVVALFSGTFAGAWAYRRDMLAVAEFSVLGLFVLSLVGGLIGALLLLWTPATIFAALVPWLILFATIVFAVGNFAPVETIQRIQLGPRSALTARRNAPASGGRCRGSRLVAARTSWSRAGGMGLARLRWASPWRPGSFQILRGDRGRRCSPILNPARESAGRRACGSLPAVPRTWLWRFREVAFASRR